MSILRDLGVLGCLTVLSPMNSLKSVAFPREGEVEIRRLARVGRVHHAEPRARGLPASPDRAPMSFPRRAGLYAGHPRTEGCAMRKLTYGMNLTLDGYIAAAGDDIGGADRRATSCSS